VGQRRGLSISLGHPIYVVSKDAQSNTVTVGERADLECVSCQVGEANWLTDPPNPGKSMEVWAKYRYNTEAVRARVEVSDAGTGLTPSGRDGRFIVRFEESQQAVAPGQAMVLYDVADPARVFGGGWIEATCC
jgi:tRNA-specific 2-thiouridylase